MPEPKKTSLPPVDRSLSRREVLLSAVAGGVTLASLPRVTAAAKTESAQGEANAASASAHSEQIDSDPAGVTPFVPENDYPYFGFEP